MKAIMSDLNERPNGVTETCADRCPIERARFLRSTAVAALAGIAGVGFLAGSASAQSVVYALSIRCPHRAVTKLDWIPTANEFHCPKHDAHFQANGELIDGRPDRSMDRFAIRRSGNTITVDMASIVQQDVAREAWDRAFVRAT